MLQKKLSEINRISILDQRNTNLGKYIIAEKHSLHPKNVKESEKNSHLSLAQPDFYYISKIWFQDSTPTQPEIFVDVCMYTTLAQPGFHYICTTWFHGSALAQPEIFMVKWHTSPALVHLNFLYICKTWFPWLFHSCCVYVFLHIHISYLYLCLN